VIAASKIDQLKEFTRWSAAHIKGDEKGEAQIFLDHLFQAFGWAKGLLEAGARCEERIKNDDGGTSFADLVWKPAVLIEMKKRGVDLSRHYRQAFDYWTRLVPNRPRYAILCNFDEFWVYEFETQMDTPVDKVRVSELSERYGPLNFLFPGDHAPVFGDHHETVTRRAADKLADCFNSMVRRGVERSLAQRFSLQMLAALFSEDIGLFEKYIVIRLLDECKSPRDTYDFIGGLFEAMNTPPPGPAGGRYAGVQYFNGGLFAAPARVELNARERTLLREAADLNWSQVRPEIFGTLFEHSLGAKEQHAFGAHYTNVADIMKIVGPTIVEPWREQIDRASTLKELRALLIRLQEFKVLDPACGSGNFLYTSYREIKRLEASIYDKMAANFPKTVDPKQRPLGFVSVRNFFGMDINPFAIDLAKVTMMLAHKLAIDELHINERALPLDNLDANFAVRDALVQADGSRSPWFKADVVIGNPPFLGAKRLKVEHSAEYVNRIRRAYREVPGMADLCVYWIRRAEDELPPCTKKDPTAGRAGLVGTQNIRNNASRVGGLDHVVSEGTIVEAVDNQPWSGDANVHVSIVNWAKTKDATLLPKNKRLWSEVAAPPPPKKEKAPKRYDLEFREVAFINSSLSDRTDVSGAVPLSCNATPQKVFQGVTPGYDGFVLKPDRAATLLKADKGANAIIRPYMIGRELNGRETRPQRFIIDAFGQDLGDLTAWPKTFEHLKSAVLPKVREKLEQEEEKKSDMVDARREHLTRWWTFWAQRTELRKWQAKHKRIIAASRTQRAPFIFHFLDTSIDFGDKLQLFAFDDDYSFGILQSYAHCAWYKAKGARLKNEVDYNYSSREVFLTFPWPQKPAKAAVLGVAEAAREVRKARQKALAAGTGMRALYATLSLDGVSALKTAHANLDEAVRVAYGFAPKKDVLAQLMTLNAEVSAAIASGKTVTPPGIPPSYSATKELASSDFVGG
jgi:hypothetical protein